METLTGKQRDVIVRHYGLDGPPLDLFTLSCEMRQAAGKPFKDSANAAYSTHKSAIAALRKKLDREVVYA